MNKDKKLIIRGMLPDVGFNISDVCLLGIGVDSVLKYFRIL